MTPSRPKYTKIPPETGGSSFISSYFFIEKSPKTAVLLKSLTRYNYNTFCEK
jgi:hypothetical protein